MLALGKLPTDVFTLFGDNVFEFFARVHGPWMAARQVQGKTRASPRMTFVLPLPCFVTGSRYRYAYSIAKFSIFSTSPFTWLFKNSC